MNKDTKTLAITIVVFLAGALAEGYYINEVMTEIEVKQAEITTLQGEISGLQEKVKKIEPLTRELTSLKANFAQYVRILPSPDVASQERLMELIQEKSDRTGFKVTQFVIKREPTTAAAASRKKKGGFQEIDLTLTSEGTFDQFLRFLNSLERHESFVRVNSFACSSSDKPKIGPDGPTWPLTVALNVSTFRYDSGGN